MSQTFQALILHILLLLQVYFLSLNVELLFHPLPNKLHPLPLHTYEELVPLLLLHLLSRKNARSCGGHFDCNAITCIPLLLLVVSHHLSVSLLRDSLYVRPSTLLFFVI